MLLNDAMHSFLARYFVASVCKFCHPLNVLSYAILVLEVSIEQFCMLDKVKSRHTPQKKKKKSIRG